MRSKQILMGIGVLVTAGAPLVATANFAPAAPNREVPAFVAVEQSSGAAPAAVMLAKGGSGTGTKGSGQSGNKAGYNNGQAGYNNNAPSDANPSGGSTRGPGPQPPNTPHQQKKDPPLPPQSPPRVPGT